MRAVAVLAAAASLFSCKGTVDDPDVIPGLEVKTTLATASAGSQFLFITAAGEWTLDLTTDDEGGTLDWISLSRTSGSGSDHPTMSYQANSGSYSRTCTIVMNTGGRTFTCQFTQAGQTAVDVTPTVEEIEDESVSGWMELPAVFEEPDRHFITHPMTINGVQTRNYSFYYDTKALDAVWVAYPLNKWTIGSGNRTNDWGIDPKIPRDKQAVIAFGGFRGDATSYGSPSFDRGHQLPSADRLRAGYNEETFYGTNMTPQAGVNFNQTVWAAFEGMVRAWSNSFDTLYVVTGCDLQGIKDYAYDNDGKKVAVPTGYFKCLLGYKKSATIGITSKTAGYTGIAFYFEHKSYSNSTAVIMGQSMTIDDLERRLDMDFFPNLEGKIGKDLAATVESTSDPWWK